MKKSIIIITICLLTASFSLVHAENPTAAQIKSDPKISIQSINNLRLKVLFDNISTILANVEITNTKGDIYYKDFNDTDKTLVLNLSHLEDGSYTLVVEAGNEKLSYAFDIQSRVTRTSVIKSK